MDNENKYDRLGGQERNNHPVLDKDRHLQDKYDEETATEIIDGDAITTDKDDPDLKNMYGWIALGLSIISFFFIPLLFAGAAIIIGFVARNREAEILGNTAIVIGVLSIVFRLFMLPLI